MAKKVKKKARSGHTEKRVSTLPQKTEPVAQQSISSTDDGLSVIKERKDILDVKIAEKVWLISEQVREGASRCRRKGEVLWTRNPSLKQFGFVWNVVIFHVGRLDSQQPLKPMQFSMPGKLVICWLSNLKTFNYTIEKLEESGEQKGPLSDIVKLVNGRSFQGASVDVEDVYFGSGSVISEIKLENTIVSSLDGKSGYAVKGLQWRDYGITSWNWMSLNPLTVSLKKLFIETSREAGLRNVINPKSFFGCVCAKASQFRGYQQHDSHELLRCLLDGLCAEELNARKQTTSLENGISSNLGPTFVDGIFGGQLSSTVSCLECGHSSTVFKPFLDLSLQFQLRNPHLKRPNLFLEPRNQSCLQNEVEGFIQSLIGMQIL
ncbi:hypothetical protein HYC85_013108 [Camellia sinensis]|uniref:USP domain-containing protein n=1 Tax=Camellia sinensis TaxID=4442 RepID=A0A7J7HEQ9_CAMSI|nr:hypothetical protein HYC85_013108 [Camellia sinensis]